MLPYQQRVVEEKKELDSKMDKLKSFFSAEAYLALPSDEKERLGRQFSCMFEYSKVLGERITHFTG